MGHITDEHVAAVNDRIAQAPATRAAFQIIDGLTRTMVDRLLDLNGIDVESFRGGMGPRRQTLADAHGWDRELI